LSVELRPASTLSLAEQTELFNAGYEEYVIPMRLNDEAALQWMMDSFDIDRDASRIAVRDGERLGFANLAIRGDEAWVGGVGVVPAARRQGIAEALMQALHDEARGRGIGRIWLEVIEQNEGAFRLYEKLGYDVVRPLEVWTIPKGDAPENSSTREVPVEQAQARIRELRATREPWQRADATVGNFTDALGIESDEGAAVFRVKGAVQLVQIAGTARELVETVRSYGDTILLNLPSDDPAADALPGLGGGVMLRQREMVLEL
jgi:ribosomal protein S18 acetylase RimI-like enzyme